MYQVFGWVPIPTGSPPQMVINSFLMLGEHLQQFVLVGQYSIIRKQDGCHYQPSCFLMVNVSRDREAFMRSVAIANQIKAIIAEFGSARFFFK